MSFLAANRLWLLLGVVALAAAYLLMQKRRRGYAVRFTNLSLLASVAPQRPGWRRHLPAGALLLALIAFVTAFAHPTRDTKVPRERATIMMAIDVSLSMQATDVQPDRLKAAKAAAATFVDLVPGRLNLG
ncbi:MAG: VWA domain-containing protein, partial [Actinomycetota bacterium]|nr:VWA domain-containing protein [Actinomycetota bacterium]